MKSFVKTGVSVLALTFAASTMAHAGQVPEIDPSVGTAGMALLAGTVMVIRGLRKR